MTAVKDVELVFVTALNGQIEEAEELLQKHFSLEELFHVGGPTQVRVRLCIYCITACNVHTD